MHLFQILGNIAILTPFVDLLKYPPGGGHFTCDKEVLVAPVGDESLLKRTFDLADSHNLPLLRLRVLCARLRFTLSLDPHPDLSLVFHRHLVWCSADTAMLSVVVGFDNLGGDVEVV